MFRVTARLLAKIGLTLVMAGAVLPTAAEETACRHERIDGGHVQAVIDGRTFVLTDGREIRLAGIEVPRAMDAAGPRGSGAEAAKSQLEALIRGEDIVLEGPNVAPDRYGRLVAYVFAGRNNSDQSVAQTMLAAGYAFVSPRIDQVCATELLGSERAARAAKLGLWGDPYYEIKSAENPVDVLAWRGRFALVEGKVLSVRESGGTIYVNFGRRWTEDFTATLSKRNERLFISAGLEPKKLQNRRVRVRGWIEERGGPWLELTRPEQIEVIDNN
jgi:endonuclease YncB( thermonuclease family)